MAPNRIEIDRILCPVDFSHFSSPALERAVRLGKWSGARVEVLHVVPPLLFAMPAGMGPSYYSDPLGVAPPQRKQSAQSLADLVAPFLGEGVPIEIKELDGEPWRVILDEAEAIPADLLVIGTHGRSGFEHLLLGSVTEKVLRRAPCPVLTVGHAPPHPRKGPLFRRILCAADLTQASEQTLEVALSLATENDSQITLLHVMETLPGDTGARLYLAVPEVGPLRYELVAEARAQLKKAVPDAARSFCEVTERVETGAPWSEILRVADQMDADLIVMGAHTRGAVGRILFGSTTSHVVRRATSPVLVIHEPKAKRLSMKAGGPWARTPRAASGGRP
jgi:nucleotide-binding universal stress UspA family protein